jgi:hypothetical protein
MFDSYKQWASLVIRKNDGTGEFLFSRQGVTQGEPLEMFGYVLRLVPLTLQRNAEFP